MSGFLIIYDAGHMLLYDDEFILTVAKKYNLLNSSGNYLMGIILSHVNFKGKFVYITDNETYNKVGDLYQARQYDLLHELYHTLKADESIIERDKRLEELNNIYKSNIDESIKE